MSEAQTASVIRMFESFMDKAETIAAHRGERIALVLAPTQQVFELFHAFMERQTGESPNTEEEHYAVCLYRGRILLGLQIEDQKHQYYGTISAWSDDQITVPDGCPLMKGSRPPESDLFEHTLWGTRMDEWLENINGPVVAAMKNHKPICHAQILQ